MHKTQVSFSDHLSSVCLSVRPSVNFSHFQFLLQNNWANFNQTWHRSYLGEEDSSLFKEGPRPSQRGDNCEIVKIHWKLKKKIFFSRTTGPTSTKLGIKYSWMKGIQKFVQMNFLKSSPEPLGQFRTNLAESIGFSCLYEGPTLFQKGNNSKIVKMHWQILKSSPLDKFYLNLTQSLLGWRGFIFLLIKGHILLKKVLKTEK